MASQSAAMLKSQLCNVITLDMEIIAERALSNREVSSQERIASSLARVERNFSFEKVMDFVTLMPWVSELLSFHFIQYEPGLEPEPWSPTAAMICSAATSPREQKEKHGRKCGLCCLLFGFKSVIDVDWKFLINFSGRNLRCNWEKMNAGPLKLRQCHI